MKNYTLVLYKSDGANTSMGCVMESWGSDFSLDTNVEEHDAIDKIVSAFCAPSEGGDYEAHLISHRNNNTIIFSFTQYSGLGWEHKEGGVSVQSQSDDWEIDNSEGNRINKLIRTIVKEVLENRRVEAEKAAALEKEKEAKRKENFERQQLAALQQKYGEK